MKDNFDTLGFYVVPQDVSSGVRQKAKEDSFASMELKFARRANPNATTKGTKSGKVRFCC
jgi:hypothetical protein